MTTTWSESSSLQFKSRWTGPFIIRSVFSHGAIEIEDPKNGNTFKVNGKILKPFLELRSMEVEKTLLKDPSYAEELSSFVVSLAKDVKLRPCGRHPSLFPL